MAAKSKPPARHRASSDRAAAASRFSVAAVYDRRSTRASPDDGGHRPPLQAQNSETRSPSSNAPGGRVPAAPPRTVSIHNAHPQLRFSRRDVIAAVALLDAHAGEFLGGCPPGELSIAFLTDAALAQIHAGFMGDPTPTDVITFEGGAATGLAGEICVSADTACEYAQAHGADFAAELTLYVVHGWLHLAGYDDLQPAKKRRMRAAEKRATGLLRAAGISPGFKLAAT